MCDAEKNKAVNSKTGRSQDAEGSNTPTSFLSRAKFRFDSCTSVTMAINNDIHIFYFLNKPTFQQMDTMRALAMHSSLTEIL